MAKALVAVLRRGSWQRPFEHAQRICRHVAPDNASTRPPHVFADAGLLCVVYAPAPTMSMRRGSVRLGVTSPEPDPLQPGSPRPDGSFAVLRADDTLVEALTDATASRTIWYHVSDDLLLASTSQRMAVALLGDLAWNEEAVAWMLANGHLGPNHSWDRRLRQLPPGSTLRLDRRSWTVEIYDGSDLRMRFEPGSDVEHRMRLGAAVSQAIAGLDLDERAWTLALSGGMDSRCVLQHLEAGPTLHTVTWGLTASSGDPDGDAGIAERVAARFHTSHQYVGTDIAPLRLETTLRRFLEAGEGRIDHLSGYMDGLDFWGDLSASGRGILRGYDAFGPKPPVRTEREARHANALRIGLDVAGPGILQESRGAVVLPPGFERAEEESLADWRDRLWLQCRTPAVTAALDEVKAAYVEIANPLLSERVVHVVRALPAHLRERKRIVAELVRGMQPELPFAARAAVQPLASIVDEVAMRALLARELRAGVGAGVLSDDLLRWLAARVMDPSARPRHRLRELARGWLPAWAVRELRLRRRSERLPLARLALRAVIVLRMGAMLREDARLGG